MSAAKDYVGERFGRLIVIAGAENGWPAEMILSKAKFNRHMQEVPEKGLR